MRAVRSDYLVELTIAVRNSAGPPLVINIKDLNQDLEKRVTRLLPPDNR